MSTHAFHRAQMHACPSVTHSNSQNSHQGPLQISGVPFCLRHVALSCGQVTHMLYCRYSASNMHAYTHILCSSRWNYLASLVLLYCSHHNLASLFCFTLLICFAILLCSTAILLNYTPLCSATTSLSYTPLCFTVDLLCSTAPTMPLTRST